MNRYSYWLKNDSEKEILGYIDAEDEWAAIVILSDIKKLPLMYVETFYEFKKVN